MRRSSPRDPILVDEIVQSEPRVAAVIRSGLLDTPAEEHFDFRAPSTKTFSRQHVQ